MITVTGQIITIIIIIIIINNRSDNHSNRSDDYCTRSENHSNRSDNHLTGQIIRVTSQIVTVTSQIIAVTGQIITVTGQMHGCQTPLSRPCLEHAHTLLTGHWKPVMHLGIAVHSASTTLSVTHCCPFGFARRRSVRSCPPEEGKCHQGQHHEVWTLECPTPTPWWGQGVRCCTLTWLRADPHLAWAPSTCMAR